MNKHTAIAAALLTAGLLAGCGGEPTVEADPYVEYQRLAPSDAPVLSREDAQARALLGCDQEWAPGTVDAALSIAYADLC